MSTMDEARKLIMDQDAELKRISEESLTVATVIQKDGNFWIVATSETHFQRVVDAPKLKIEKGDTVFIHGRTNQIVDKGKNPISSGVIATIGRIKDGFAEIESNGEARQITFREGMNVREGDRVLLDPSGHSVAQNLGPWNSKNGVDSNISVSWNDIGGLSEAKEQMIEAVELPHKNKDIFRFYNKKISKGILLYGPPGCGKTLLGKAAATSLAKIYGKNHAGSFLYVKGPEILNKYVGESESNVRALFAKARRHKADHGFPAVIFIDEADAVLGKRGDGENGSFMKNTIVPMFLSEMDGMEDSAAIVILATNRPDALDPAIVREGRIDRKIKISRPLAKDAEKILLMNIKDCPTARNQVHKDLAKFGTEEIYSPHRVIYRLQTQEGNEKVILLSHLVSGAMMAGIADYALSFAMKRDLNSGRRTGLMKEDIKNAVDAIDKQCRDIDHSEVIEDFIEQTGEEIEKIVKAA